MPPAARSAARCGIASPSSRASASSATRARIELIVERRALRRRAIHDDAGIDRRSARARAVLLATGGAGQVFSETTNPPIATGDGVCSAWFAGARVADLEFVQFHPTALDVPGAPRFLLSEALRGEGAQLLNADGERFMTRYEPAGELASRDLRLARDRARAAPHRRRRCTCRWQHLDPAWMRARFPTIAGGVPVGRASISARDRIPVGPAAHYVMGGVETDLWGRTTLPGLFAAGEVACTGVHGANRLASNSLLEGLVFGARAAQAMLQPAVAGGCCAGVSASRGDRAAPAATSRLPWPRPTKTTCGRLMWNSRRACARCGRRCVRAVARSTALRRRGCAGATAAPTACAARQPRDRRPPDGARRAAPRGNARQPRPGRLSVPRRCKLEDSLYGDGIGLD